MSKCTSNGNISQQPISVHIFALTVLSKSVELKHCPEISPFCLFNLTVAELDYSIDFE